MRRHGWQLPYHPLQVVAVAVFLALGFAFYVFLLPFVGRKPFECVLLGLYTPLVACVFCLYVWCAATDPGDPGVFKSKKYLNVKDNRKQSHLKEFKQGSSTSGAHAAANRDKSMIKGIGTDAVGKKLSNALESKDSSLFSPPILAVLLEWCPPILWSCCESHEQSSQQHMSEDGMLYCSLCEVEVLKHSKHCRVCDKCVDSFDHHCRWLNNCIGRKNYRKFFILMVSALLLLILQWLMGILVLIICFLERERFSMEIISKLGSGFSLVPFVVVVALCTLLAMIATIPLAQLFSFHVLLIKKGISTYDYIIALREQEQQDVCGQQSQQMSPMSSLTALSSVSSFRSFHRGAWCTPPQLFLDDQYDAIPPETGTSASSVGKKVTVEESTKKRSASTVNISPWALSRLNAEEVSKVAAQARMKSKVLQPVVRWEKLLEQETGSSFSSGSSRMVARPDDHRRANKRGRLPVNYPLETLTGISANATDCNGRNLAPEATTSLAPLQLEARSAFWMSQAMSSAGIVDSSPDSSLGSPNLHVHPFWTSTGAKETQGLVTLAAAGTAAQKGIQLSRSTSDGYEASSGEDSDRVPSRIVHRSSNWSSLLLNSGQEHLADRLKASLSSDKQQASTRSV